MTDPRTLTDDQLARALDVLEGQLSHDDRPGAAALVAEAAHRLRSGNGSVTIKNSKAGRDMTVTAGRRWGGRR